MNPGYPWHINTPVTLHLNDGNRRTVACPQCHPSYSDVIGWEHGSYSSEPQTGCHNHIVHKQNPGRFLTPMNLMEQRWRQCPLCANDFASPAACSKCGQFKPIFHSYPMEIMAMNLPTYDLHIAAHETLLRKSLCIECATDHAHKTVATLLEQATLEPVTTTQGPT